MKGIAITTLGLLLGIFGTDVTSGFDRFTFGLPDLADGIEIVALALGLFGIAESMKSINKVEPISCGRTNLKLGDMRPSGADLSARRCRSSGARWSAACAR